MKGLGIECWWERQREEVKVACVWKVQLTGFADGWIVSVKNMTSEFFGMSNWVV